MPGASGSRPPACPGPSFRKFNMETPPNREEQLAELIGRRLRALPPPKAPRSLAPRVRAAILARQRRPWWRKSWFEWPLPVQASFLVLTASLVAAVAWYGPKLSPFGLFDDPRELLISQFAFAKPVGGLAVALVNDLILAAKSAGQMFWTAVIAFLIAAYLACVGIGTVCYRLVVSTSHQQSL